MEYTNRLKKIIEEQLPNGESVIYDFFITLSRFEWALKSIPEFLIGKNAQPDWNRFAHSISDVFYYKHDPLLRQSVENILQHPPKRQINSNGQLEWDACLVDENATMTFKLSVYIKRIKLNLLHGDKFHADHNLNDFDHKRISSATVILNNWLGLDIRVRDNFLESIEAL